MGRRDARRARARGNARDGKAQNKTGSLGAGRGETEASSDRWSPRIPRGRVTRVPSCVSATGRIPHLQIVRFLLPRQSSSRFRLDAGADRRRYHVCSVECTRARKNKRKMPPPSRCLLAWHPDRMSIERRLGNLSRDPRCAPVRCARETAVRATRQRQWPLQLSLPKSTPRWRLLARISRYPGISSASRVKSVVRSNRPSIDRPAASTRAQFGGNGRSGTGDVRDLRARRDGPEAGFTAKGARRRTKFGRAICAARPPETAMARGVSKTLTIVPRRRRGWPTAFTPARVVTVSAREMGAAVRPLPIRRAGGASSADAARARAPSTP